MDDEYTLTTLSVSNTANLLALLQKQMRNEQQTKLMRDLELKILGALNSFQHDWIEQETKKV